MKHRTLLALAVTGALGSSVAFADTFVCTTPSDLSYTTCAPAAFDSRRPSAVQYYAIERQPSVVFYEPVVTRAPATVFATPEVSSKTITTYQYRSWPNTEPIVKTERYTYGPWIYYYER